MKQNKQNTSLIISALKKGDEHIFKSIYDNYKKALTAFINGYTKDQAQTDDIIQDTFIKLWNAKENLDKNTSISSYLHKTAYNTFIDKYRKKKREHSMLDGWLYKRLMQMVDENEEVKNKKIILVREAIDKLPPKCKEIFVLSKYENLKYIEIAEHLNISTKTVESQMRIAFNIIREEFKDKGFLNLFFLFMKRSLRARIV